MNTIRGINHLTFAVTDLERAISFYTMALGMELVKKWEKGAYLLAGRSWICLSLDEECRKNPHPDYTHTAFDVSFEEFEKIRENIIRHGAPVWKDNKSEGLSYYFLDPDHHKLEIHVGTLETRLASMV